MKVFALKVGIAGFAFLNVLVFVYVSQPPDPVNVTLGRLADKGNDFRKRMLVVENAGGGERMGRFLVFRSNAKDRNTVVFELRNDNASGTMFSGYCQGIRTEPIQGCPVDPPFVYVTNVTPP